ncbi:hypothetical protein IV417_06000 [Alphaproteobacteria bacterium KMM 3653]|uniref:Uncharacterized protein n=1 Tax=Harenicola maris TaxID=2841044 RepID=A0AAP2CNN5_9RHOB|nr:hypothetical protein [Harenicola maris]
MTKTLTAAALATLISAPAFAGGVTANEWFINQLEADGNYTQLKQVEQGSTALIGTRGSAGALDVAARFAAEANERQLAENIAQGEISGIYTTTGTASDANLKVAIKAAKEDNKHALVRFLEAKLAE